MRRRARVPRFLCWVQMRGAAPQPDARVHARPRPHDQRLPDRPIEQCLRADRAPCGLLRRLATHAEARSEKTLVPDAVVELPDPAVASVTACDRRMATAPFGWQELELGLDICGGWESRHGFATDLGAVQRIRTVKERRRPQPSAVGAKEDGSDGRGPPPYASMGGWCPGGVEVSCDLTQAFAGRAVSTDAVDDVRRHRRWTTGWVRFGSRLGRPSPFGDQSLELVDRD